MQHFASPAAHHGADKARWNDVSPYIHSPTLRSGGVCLQYVLESGMELSKEVSDMDVILKWRTVSGYRGNLIKLCQTTSNTDKSASGVGGREECGEKLSWLHACDDTIIRSVPRRNECDNNKAIWCSHKDSKAPTNGRETQFTTLGTSAIH